jgi:uncharacterized lipoprotein YehR (DUF1307 family)
MNIKLIAALLLVSFSFVGCGKSEEEKKKEAIAAYGYGTEPAAYPEPSHSKF